MNHLEFQRRAIMSCDPKRHKELATLRLPDKAFYDVVFLGGNRKQQSRVWSKKYLESWLSRHDLPFNDEGDISVRLPDAVGHKYIEYHPE